MACSKIASKQTIIPEISYIDVSPGLLTGKVEDTDTCECVLNTYENCHGDNYLETIGVEFNLLQSKGGGRVSSIFPGYPMDSVPKMKTEKADKYLNILLNIKNRIFDKLIKECPFLKGVTYENTISFHKYQCVSEEERPFKAHIDYGTIAIIFTLGHGFQFSLDNGKTWINLHDSVPDENISFIVNFGRLYSTFTGINPVLHRVVSKGNLAEFDLPEFSKLTVAFFIEPHKDTLIPTEIPSTITGIHMSNWQFLIDNFKTFGEYNDARRDGIVVDDSDGLLVKV
jgi:hypothetical protein